MYETLGANLRRMCVPALLAALLEGCSIVPAPIRSPHIDGDGVLGGRADFFASLDGRASEAEALDPGAFRVEGYPYLRTNRFLASFRDAVADKGPSSHG
jgi:hypothetical protein